MRFSEADVCVTFDEQYKKLSIEDKSHKIASLFSDELGFLLLDVCELLPHAPATSTLMHIDTAIASDLDGMPAIIYTLRHNPNSICENALIVLVKTKENKIRMFTVETHIGTYVLCEYINGMHKNYGPAGEEVITKQIPELIQHREQYNMEGRRKMSAKGDWGNKIIIALHSDGKRRHKKWCDNYCDDYCTARQSKCIGSPHCDYYQNKNEQTSDVFYSKPAAGNEDVNVARTKSGFIWCEHYRQASYGDKLLHNVILVKNTAHSFKICEVMEEDFYFFKVNFDGHDHKYSKRVAYENGSVYIFIGETALEHGEES